MNTCARKSRPRCASLSLLTPGCSLLRYAAPTKARKKAPAPAATALRTTSLLPTVRHQQARPLKPSGRPPQSSSKAHLYTDYGRPERNPSASLRMSVAAAATHDVNAFASAGGSSLVILLRNSSVDACIDTLFSVTGASAGQVFNQAKMVTIANALQSGAPGHTKCGRASPAFWRIRYSTRAFPPISAHPTGSIFRRSRAAGGGRGEVGDRREQALDSLIRMQDRHSRSCAGARASPSLGEVA
jgi:microbial collagenase